MLPVTTSHSGTRHEEWSKGRACLTHNHVIEKGNNEMRQKMGGGRGGRGKTDFAMKKAVVRLGTYRQGYLWDSLKECLLSA